MSETVHSDASPVDDIASPGSYTRPIYLKWPGDERAGDYLAIALIFLTSLAALNILMLATPGWPAPREFPNTQVTFLVLIGGPGLIFLVAAAYRWRLERRAKAVLARTESDGREPGTIHPGDDERMAATTDAILRLRLAHRRPRWYRRKRLEYEPWRRAFESRGLPAPRFVVERKFSAGIAGIPQIEGLLEPEPVESRGDRRKLFGDLFGIGFVTLILSGCAANWWIGAPIVVVAIGGALALATIARSHGFDFFPRSTPIAAPGALADRRGRVWSAVDSLTTIRKEGGALQVDIIAADGRVRLVYSSPKDQGFVTFWARWSHPHPRPELLRLS